MEFFEEMLFFASDALQNVSNTSIAVATMSAILGFILAVLGYYIIRDYGVPPGPTGVPILGYWPYIDIERAHLHQVELKKKYGDVFSFRVTGKLYIHLASHKVLKEAHITKTDIFRERTQDFTLLRQIFDEGIVFSTGEKWKAVRGYFLTQFRDRGMTLFKENTADAVDETVCGLVDDLKRFSNEPVDIHKILISKSNSMIRNTLFGYGTPVTEEDINNIYEEYRQVTQIIHSKNILLHGIFAKYFIIPRLPFYKEAMKIASKTKKRLQEMINEHRRTFDGDHVRDIIDSFILEKNNRRAKGDETYHYFTDETLVSNLFQFVGDGVVSVSTFVTFMVMALLDHPEEQEKIYQEMVEVCGEDRNPTKSDKSKLKYFNAFLLEAQRTTNFVPLFPSLECSKETTIGGYRIPKGAITVTNIYAINTDPQAYEDPEKFNPSRFLGVNGKAREELPISFGAGKRVCVGEGYVLMQIFVYLAAIVKNFKLSYEVPKTCFEVVLTRSLKVHVTPRK